MPIPNNIYKNIISLCQYKKWYVIDRTFYWKITHYAIEYNAISKCNLLINCFHVGSH